MPDWLPCPVIAMKFAYADPPYPGCAHLYPEKRDVDHRELIEWLERDYPDGWALSTSSTALQHVLGLCPASVRVMAWVKPFAVFKPNVNPAYAWEPVIVRGGRPRTRAQITVRDWVSAGITLKRGLVGAKPDAFYHWLLLVLNVKPNDTLTDIYPGTNGLQRVRRQGALILNSVSGP